MIFTSLVFGLGFALLLTGILALGLRQDGPWTRSRANLRVPISRSARRAPPPEEDRTFVVEALFWLFWILLLVILIVIVFHLYAVL